jgi:hypothetical protein
MISAQELEELHYLTPSIRCCLGVAPPHPFAFQAAIITFGTSLAAISIDHPEEQAQASN